MRNLETWTAAAALALTTNATLLVSPALGLIALVISAVSFGLALARASDHGQDHLVTLRRRGDLRHTREPYARRATAAPLLGERAAIVHRT
jgi:hypothetical protein